MKENKKQTKKNPTTVKGSPSTPAKSKEGKKCLCQGDYTHCG